MTSLSDRSFQSKLLVVGLQLVAVGLCYMVTAYAGDLWGNATQLVNDVKGKIVGMSSAAATVGVGTGAFMKKFSMGKQEKIELGNKVIKDSIVSWAVLNGLTLILSWLNEYTS